MISDALMQKLSVMGLCDDSRRVKPGDLFFSMPADGYEMFAQNAVASGAVAVVGETPAPEGLASKWIQVADVKAARLEAAQTFYKDPFAKLACHAVTGTNGKTTSAFLMNAMLESAGHKTALLGTIKNKIGDSSVQATLTTPGLLDLFAFAAKAVAAGCSDLVMEASSHSLHQGRVAGIRFRSALFSNLTQDHLDYHKTMENYFEAKKLLFTKYLAENGVAVINIDDAYGDKLYESLTCKKVAVSRRFVAILTWTTCCSCFRGRTRLAFRNFRCAPPSRVSACLAALKRSGTRAASMWLSITPTLPMPWNACSRRPASFAAGTWTWFSDAVVTATVPSAPSWAISRKRLPTRHGSPRTIRVPRSRAILSPMCVPA